MIRVLRETHNTSENVAQRLERAGGINRFGEPNYRAVWGWNRLAWIGGKFEEDDPATGSLLREVVELRREPKYPAVNAQEAIAYATAALAGWARGSPLAEKWDEAAADALEDLVAAAVRREQQSARRRRPL